MTKDTEVYEIEDLLHDGSGRWTRESLLFFSREDQEIWICDGAYRRTSVVDKERGVFATYILCRSRAVALWVEFVCWLKEVLKKSGKYPLHHSRTKARKVTGPQKIPVSKWSGVKLPIWLIARKHKFEHSQYWIDCLRSQWLGNGILFSADD
jgi:hypothetical protein